MKLVHHESCQIKQRHGLSAHNQMDKPSIRLIYSNGGAPIGPLGLGLKALYLARTGKLRTGLRGGNDMLTILPIAYRHDGGYAVIRNLEYGAVPRKVSVRGPGVRLGISIVQFSFRLNQQTERTIVCAINPGICHQERLFPARDRLLTTSGNVSFLPIVRDREDDFLQPQINVRDGV